MLTAKQIVDNLNLTGNFLEASVFFELVTSGRFLATAEWPYSQPTFQGTADIIALNHHVEWGSEPLVFFAIECKKAKPDQKVWVFDVSRTSKDMLYPMVKIDQSGRVLYERTTGYLMPSTGINSTDDAPIFNKGYELRESDGNLSRNDSERIYTSLTQANKAAISLVKSNYKDIFSVHPDAFEQHPTAIVPVVITNATIKIIKYSPKNINNQSGEISVKDVELENKDWIFFDYPLPHDLQLNGKYGDSSIRPIKRPTYVISAPKAIEKMDEISRYAER